MAGGAQLKLVEPRFDARDPEALLALLFAREADLQRQLRQVSEALGDARSAYAAHHGLLMHPHMDALRERLGPTPEDRLAC
jgi:hypothetical protein